MYSRHDSGGRFEAQTARQSANCLTAGVINATLEVQSDDRLLTAALVLNVGALSEPRSRWCQSSGSWLRIGHSMGS